MKASGSAILAFASCFACACAQGYDATGDLRSATLGPPSAILDGSFGGGGAAAPSSGGMGGGMAVPLGGEPCLRNDVAPCPCEGTDAQGQRLCVFNMASPTQGFFSECQGCPAPEPVDPPDATASCTDAMQNGAETGTDCGGPECAPCPLGSACATDADCANTSCISSVCTMPPSGGTGGMGGAGGAPGADAGGEPPIDEPVEDCDGVPVGTECNRDCILPTNTARCNSRGNCSCL